MSLTVSLALAAVNSPVVVAMVVNSTLAIKEQTILADFICQGTVGAFVEFVAAGWVRVQLQPIAFWAFIELLRRGCEIKGRGEVGSKDDEGRKVSSGGQVRVASWVGVSDLDTYTKVNWVYRCRVLKGTR
ncbi:hypothetical protein E2C01_028881 [Portunus trituberculatus]|uniref:Uncharacterized protein n=1 Tax=Portunus trituberculatus TaxID=210409 RepID=A0A5B7EQ95_PORTR|nr:hypothetical protein [Portunus trituberculatus]